MSSAVSFQGAIITFVAMYMAQMTDTEAIGQPMFESGVAVKLLIENLPTSSDERSDSVLMAVAGLAFAHVSNVHNNPLSRKTNTVATLTP